MSFLRHKLMRTVSTTNSGGGSGLSGSSYDNVSFSISDQDTNAQGLTFSNDGTKFFMVGTGSDSVHQYNLTTGFDLSTASYSGVSFSVAAQDGGPSDVTFNSTGTRMFIIGAGLDRVYQYTLTTAFDLNTASYDSVSFSVSTQDNNPTRLAFNLDGTKMFVMGTSSNSVHQYTLSTGFNVGTASYDSVSFDVSAQGTPVSGLEFNSDGTKMFVVDLSSDSVHQYSLSTEFDLSTASVDGVSFSVAAQDTFPVGFTFNPSDTNMYVIGLVNTSIYQYSLGS